MITSLWLPPLVTTIAIVGVATADAAPSRHAAGQLSITVSEAKALYSEIFEFEAKRIPGEGEQTFEVSSKLAELDDAHPLASLLKEAGHLVRYMLGETGIATADRRAAAASVEFPEPYLELLKRDDRFSSTFLSLVDLHLRQSGGGVQGLPSSGKDFRAGDVLNVAVRFIYPDGIEADGSIRAHICSGINGLADMPNRNPFVEALAYSAIVRELDAQDSALINDIRESLKLAQSLELSADSETAILRAQGVAWAYLRESDKMQTVLRQEYERIGHLLPIRVEFSQ